MPAQVAALAACNDWCGSRPTGDHGALHRAENLLTTMRFIEAAAHSAG